MSLRVIEPFAGHAVGETITDSAEIEAVLASDQARFVVRVADDPEPATPPAAAVPVTE